MARSILVTMQAILASFAALGTGIIAKTGTNTTAVRTLTGTAGEIAVTNGDGVSGNPTFADSPGYSTLTDAATIAVDLSLATRFGVTLGGNRTMGAPSSIKAGQTYYIAVTQDGTGGRTLAWNAAYLFPWGTPTLTPTAAAVDTFVFLANAAGTALTCVSVNVNGKVLVGTGIESYGVGLGSVTGNARGAGAVDLQFTRTVNTQVASGTGSVLLGGSGSSMTGTMSGGGGSSVANSGTYTWAYGASHSFSGTRCGVTGESNSGAGGYGQVSGASNTYSGSYGRVNGQGNTANANYQDVSGNGITASHYGAQENGALGGHLGDIGDDISFGNRYGWGRRSTDATNTETFLDGAVGGSARYTLQNYSMHILTVQLVVRKKSGAATDYVYSVPTTLVVWRGANAASTTLAVGGALTLLGDATIIAAGLTAVFSADTTNGALKLMTKGVAAQEYKFAVNILGRVKVVQTA